jgi:hypothetical protein
LKKKGSKRKKREKTGAKKKIKILKNAVPAKKKGGCTICLTLEPFI